MSIQNQTLDVGKLFALFDKVSQPLVTEEQVANIELNDEGLLDYGVMKQALLEELNNIRTHRDHKDKGLFSLAQFKGNVFKSSGLEQEVQNTDLLNLAIYEQGNETPKDQIIYLGDKRLGLYTTLGQLEKEKELINIVLAPNPNASYYPREQSYLDLIDESKNEIETTKKLKFSAEQTKAALSCMKSDSFVSLVQGVAGAGKSTLVSWAVITHIKRGFKAIGLTLSWKAASVLQNETKMKCFSVESFLTRARRAADERVRLFDSNCVLVLDEAGLLGVDKMLDLFRYIKRELQTTAVKVLVLGDETQLNPVGEPNALEILSRILPNDAKSWVTEIRRQNSNSHRQAVLLLRDGFSGEALYAFLQQGMLEMCANQQELMEKLTDDYCADLVENPTDSMLIVSLNNKMNDALNHMVRDKLIKMGKIDVSTEISINIEKKINDVIMPFEQKFAVGDKIVFNKNDKTVKIKKKDTDEDFDTFLMNRMQARISKIEVRPNGSYDIYADLEVEDDEGKMIPAYVKINTREYWNPDIDACKIDLNYAITAYSSQGQTVKRVFLVDGDGMDRRYSYVSCSRHREALKIYANRDELIHHMKRTIHKDKEIEDLKKLSNLDLFNFMSMRWGRKKDQKSITISLLDKMEYLKRMSKHYNKKIDILNLPPDFEELDREFQNLERKQEREKYFIQKTRDVSANGEPLNIMDTPEYYRPQRDFVDFNNMTHVYNPNMEDFSYVPKKEKRKYFLTEMITPDFFEKHKGKYFDIGKGGELVFLAKHNDVVISKYNVFGEEKLQIGYPFIVNSGMNNDNKDVFVVQDLNQFWHYVDLFYVNDENHDESPVLIWGTKDTDYSHILKSFDNKSIFLMGDTEYKDQHFKKITQAINGFELNSTFENITKEEIVDYDNLINLSKIKLKKVNHQKNDSILDVSISINDDEDDFMFSEKKPVHLSELCNEQGKIYDNILYQFIVEKEKLLTEADFNKFVLEKDSNKNKVIEPKKQEKPVENVINKVKSLFGR